MGGSGDVDSISIWLNSRTLMRLLNTRLLRFLGVDFNNLTEINWLLKFADDS